ncbi:lasso RiPP family leader peptide-containing protein [Streptomyces endophytica]|uniref:Lasso RiPP family leader peptide-containing protein n=1 Tax=Streptomyces endophytica TaxID=2991496 RepID=A0ABY6PD75_9ACTN|nr:lasso RiPP family leader peptide-containing protein [Streptomyces endophytica]UZJ31167.1 lasso RiPP family leader peptide-containing protein [Streptomyces endophytica]
MQDTQEVPAATATATATATAYEAPQLIEVGGFTDLTLGFSGYHWDGWAGRAGFFGW